MPAPTVLNVATGQLVHAAAISNPTGGATVDAEARTAVNSILSVLRTAGVIAGQSGLNLAHTFNVQTSQVVLRGPITDPTGGATVDANCRTTIGSILTVLRNAMIIQGATTTLVTFTLDEDQEQLKVGAAIADVTAGGTTDTEGRAAINSALAAMRLAGLIAAD